MEGNYRIVVAYSTNNATRVHTPRSTRPSSPYNARGNPFEDEIQPGPPPGNSFDSHPPSFGSFSGARPLSNIYFRSRRIKKEENQKPWLEKKDPREKWVTIIPLIGLFVGLVIAGLLIWDGVKSVVHHEYCLVLSDDFSGGLNGEIWTKEAEVGGYGLVYFTHVCGLVADGLHRNGQFEQTTLDDENVFIEDGKLVIKPTLQDAKLIESNNVINLTRDGTCSSSSLDNCVAITNTTAGSIIPPVRSGRISTKKGATIKYGRVEVTAVLPTGDWLWPAIWMLPVSETYGPWPASGEIDICESRGNNHTHPQGGNNIVSSAIHWGPNSANNGWWRTNGKRSALHTTYGGREHTFGVEWSEKYLFTYVDSRLLQVLYTDFAEPLWKRGNFPLSDINGTRLVDIWSQTGRAATPFDQEFYLVLNVAVGGTNGWFEDGANGKPWVNGSPNAKRDFWDARERWFPTWENKGQMTVSKVEMWQQCDGNEGGDLKRFKGKTRMRG